MGLREKAVTIPPSKTMQITFQHKYTPTSYQTQLDFQGTSIIFVDTVDTYNAFYLIVIKFEAKSA